MIPIETESKTQNFSGRVPETVHAMHCAPLNLSQMKTKSKNSGGQILNDYRTPSQKSVIESIPRTLSYKIPDVSAVVMQSGLVRGQGSNRARGGKNFRWRGIRPTTFVG